MKPADGALRIALLNAWYWPEVRRGSERVVHDVAMDLMALGHRPRLLTSHAGPPRRSVEDGLPVFRSWRPPDVLLRARNVQEALTHVPFSYLALRAGDDDVAHAFFATDALAAVEWGRRSGRPAVFSFMGVPQREAMANRRMKLRILERVTAGADAVVVLSEVARDAMWRWLGVEARIVHPGVDLARFTPGGPRAEQPTIVCAGDIGDQRKRADLLVAGFARVQRARPQARLVLMRPSDSAVQERYAGDGVEFADLDSGEVPGLFREAWVSGLTSYDEAFGLVLVESLACGTPVFAARDGGGREIVDRPAVGSLFDGDSPEAVASAMLECLELAEDPATASACRERAEDFDTLSGTRAYEALYRELIASG